MLSVQTTKKTNSKNQSQQFHCPEKEIFRKLKIMVPFYHFHWSYYIVTNQQTLLHILATSSLKIINKNNSYSSFMGHDICSTHLPTSLFAYYLEHSYYNPSIQTGFLKKIPELDEGGKHRRPKSLLSCC
jgi:hypothetical protein